MAEKTLGVPKFRWRAGHALNVQGAEDCDGGKALKQKSDARPKYNAVNRIECDEKRSTNDRENPVKGQKIVTS
jgi:hypothetical protein